MRTPSVLLGIALTAGLASLGLWLSGSGARALAYVHPAASGLGDVEAMDGSATGRVEEVVLNGRPMRVLVCTTSRSPRQVLDYYGRLAERQTGPDVPFVAAKDGQGGAVLWTSPDGVSRAVLVEAHPTRSGGARYRILLDGSGKSLGAPTRGAGLAAGVRSEDFQGWTLQSSVSSPDGTGTLVFTGPGDVRGGAHRMLEALEARGFSCDRDALEAYRPGAGRLVIPLTHGGGARGTLSLTPGEGQARACLSVYSGA